MNILELLLSEKEHESCKKCNKFVSLCDNGCNTLYCCNCYKEYYKQYFMLRSGHSPNCGKVYKNVNK